MADLFRQRVFEKLADKLADLAINDPQMRGLIVMIMNELQQSKEINEFDIWIAKALSRMH